MSFHDTWTPVELPPLLAVMRSHVLSAPSERTLNARELLFEVADMLPTCAKAEPQFKRTLDGQWWLWSTDGDFAGRPRWWAEPDGAVSLSICFQ